MKMHNLKSNSPQLPENLRYPRIYFNVRSRGNAHQRKRLPHPAQQEPQPGVILSY
jgi:hypothetical protein